MPIPQVEVGDVLVTGDRAEIIRRAETEEDVFRRDIVPGRLRAARHSEQPEAVSAWQEISV